MRDGLGASEFWAPPRVMQCMCRRLNNDETASTNFYKLKPDFKIIYLILQKKICQDLQLYFVESLPYKARNKYYEQITLTCLATSFLWPFIFIQILVYRLLIVLLASGDLPFGTRISFPLKQQSSHEFVLLHPLRILLGLMANKTFNDNFIFRACLFL